jgi:required for meiotic nuclear division protein 1
MSVRTHQFNAVAFVENFNLRELATAIPGGRLTAKELHLSLALGSDVFFYPFGAVVFHGVPEAERKTWIDDLRAARPGLTRQVVSESFTVREEPGVRTDIVDGALQVEKLTSGRAAVIALITAQSAAMEYYEKLVDDLFSRTAALAEPLEKRGTVSVRTTKLHRFIGEAINSRNEVLSVLYLLDKPDQTWDDPEIDRIYDDLRAEFDLVDRYQALESKLNGVQSALELVLDVARERRMWLLEVSIALLILVELVLSIFRR